jgi:Zn ribbon nucleic-acid-binding protein
MKNTQTCPKCQNQEILRIPGRVGSHGSGNNIPVGITIFSSVTVTRFVCVKCGFSEEWVESPEDIKAIVKKYGRR